MHAFQALLAPRPIPRRRDARSSLVVDGRPPTTVQRKKRAALDAPAKDLLASSPMNIATRTQHLLRCGFLCLVASVLTSVANLLAAGPTPHLPATPPKLEAAYWRDPIFLIPYRFAPNQPLADQVDKIRLLVAEETSGPWTFLEEGEPHLQGFKYHAPRDGEYWFAVQLVDRLAERGGCPAVTRRR